MREVEEEMNVYSAERANEGKVEEEKGKEGKKEEKEKKQRKEKEEIETDTETETERKEEKKEKPKRKKSKGGSDGPISSRTPNDIGSSGGGVVVVGTGNYFNSFRAPTKRGVVRSTPTTPTTQTPPPTPTSTTTTLLLKRNFQGLNLSFTTTTTTTISNFCLPPFVIVVFLYIPFKPNRETLSQVLGYFRVKYTPISTLTELNRSIEVLFFYLLFFFVFQI